MQQRANKEVETDYISKKSVWYYGIDYFLEAVVKLNQQQPFCEEA